jgi:hypothetical protein
MPRYVHKDTGHTVETSVAREGQELKSQGYREQAARTKAVREADKQAEKSTK